MKFKAIISVALAGLALGTTQAFASSSPFAPQKFHEVNLGDKAFLRVVNGYANQMNSAVKRGKRCVSTSCMLEAMSDFGLAGNYGRVFIPIGLRSGVKPYFQKPTTPCVRKVGAAVAYMAARADAVSTSAFNEQEAAMMKAIREYNVASARAIRLAKACQKATA